MKSKAPLAKCNECPLADHRFCPSAGPLQSDVVVIGEAPGAQELRQGTPFVGPSGELLRATLDASGYPNDEIFYTNAVLCQAGFQRGKGGPPWEAIQSCRERLIEEVRRRRPKLLLALGGSAITAVKGRPVKVTEERGRRWWSDVFGAWVMASFHPALVLHTKTLSDRVSRFVDFSGDIYRTTKPVPEHPRTDYRVLNTVGEALGGLEALFRKGPRAIAIDLETDGFDPRKNAVLCITMSWREGRSFVFPEHVINDERVRGAFTRLFKRPSITWIMHNAKFDIQFLWKCIGTAPKLGFDTLLAHYCLDERKYVHGLKRIVMEEWEIPDYEEELKQALGKHWRTESYRKVPEQILYKYAARDADFTYRLWKIFEGRMREDGVLRVHDQILVPAMSAWAKIETYGLLVDRERHRTLVTEYAGEIAKRIVGLRQIAGDPDLNLNSPQQLSRIIFGKLGMPVLKRTPTGNPSTNAEVLNRLSGKHPFIDALQEYRSLFKIYSTYLKNLPIDDDGRVRADVDLTGTVTGRLSCREPNLMNQPRSGGANVWGRVIRELFTAPEGYVYLYPDYSQGELRVMAHVSKDPFLLDVYWKGLDIHDEVSLELFGEGFTKEDRMISKMWSFGLAYSGGRHYSMAERAGLDMDTAAEMARRYYGRMPGLAKWIDSVKEQMRTGEIQTPLGRKRRFPLIENASLQSLENEAVNFVPQSVCSDLTLLSLIRLHEQIQGTGGRVLMMVHDSLLLEVPERDAMEVARLCRDIMEQVPRDFLGDTIPFTVDVALGKRWGDVKEIELT